MHMETQIDSYMHFAAVLFFSTGSIPPDKYTTCITDDAPDVRQILPNLTLAPQLPV